QALLTVAAAGVLAHGTHEGHAHPAPGTTDQPALVARCVDRNRQLVTTSGGQPQRHVGAGAAGPNAQRDVVVATGQWVPPEPVHLVLERQRRGETTVLDGDLRADRTGPFVAGD